MYSSSSQPLYINYCASIIDAPPGFVNGKCSDIRLNAIFVTVQPTASLLQKPAHLKFAVRKGLDSLAEFMHSHGLCSKCKVLS